MKQRWQLVATLIEVPWRFGDASNRMGRVFHVCVNSAGTKLRCSCTGNTPQAVPYDDTHVVGTWTYPDKTVVCQHIRALYIENPSGFVKVNFTERGKELFHSLYAARALSDGR